MSKKVDFYGFDKQGNDVCKGSLILQDGKWQTVGEVWIKGVVKPIRVLTENGPTRFDPQQDPEGFLNALQHYYRGAYLRATAPQDV